MNKYIGIALLFSALSMGSCISEESDDGKCSDKLKLLYDWSHGKAIQSSDSLSITAPDGTITRLKTNNVGVDLKLRPGEYSLVAYEPTPTVKVTGTTLAIGVDANGYAIDPAPFSAGITNFSILNGGSQVRYLPMYYQTRELIIKLNFKGLGVETLSSVDGWMDGITISRDMVDGFTPLDGQARHTVIVGGKTSYDFAISDSELPDVIQFSGVRRLLGINGPANQMLYLTTIHFTGGERDAEFDITQALNDFHISNVGEPFVVVLTINISEDFTATITDWISGGQSTLDAH